MIKEDRALEQPYDHTTKKLVIFGLDDMAEVVKFMFERDSDYQVAAFTVDRAFKTQDRFCGLPVCDFETVEQIYPPEEYEMFLGGKVSRGQEKGVPPGQIY